MPLTGYTVSGLAGGLLGNHQAITLHPVGGLFTTGIHVTVTITLPDASTIATVLTTAAGFNPAAVFYANQAGTHHLVFTNDAGLTDPAPLDVVVRASDTTRPVLERILLDLVTTLSGPILSDPTELLTVRRVNNQDDYEALVNNPTDDLVIVWPDLANAQRTPGTPQGQDSWTQPIQLTVYLQHLETDTTVPIEEQMLTRWADIVKALTADVTRGGYSWNTTVDGPGAVTTAGGGLYRIEPTVLVRYRTYENNPYRSVTGSNA